MQTPGCHLSILQILFRDGATYDDSRVRQLVELYWGQIFRETWFRHSKHRIISIIILWFQTLEMTSALYAISSSAVGSLHISAGQSLTSCRQMHPIAWCRPKSYNDMIIRFRALSWFKSGVSLAYEPKSNNGGTLVQWWGVWPLCHSLYQLMHFQLVNFNVYRFISRKSKLGMLEKNQGVCFPPLPPFSFPLFLRISSPLLLPIPIISYPSSPSILSSHP